MPTSYTAVCIGGPIDGQTLACESPRVLVPTLDQSWDEYVNGLVAYTYESVAFPNGDRVPVWKFENSTPQDLERFRVNYAKDHPGCMTPSHPDWSTPL